MDTPKHEFYNKILKVLNEKRAMSLSKYGESEFTRDENHFLKGALEELVEMGLVNTSASTLRGGYYLLSPSGNEKIRTNDWFTRKSFKEKKKSNLLSLQWYLEKFMENAIGGVVGFVIGVLVGSTTCTKSSQQKNQSNRQQSSKTSLPKDTSTKK